MENFMIKKRILTLILLFFGGCLFVTVYLQLNLTDSPYKDGNNTIEVETDLTDKSYEKIYDIVEMDLDKLNISNTQQALRSFDYRTETVEAVRMVTDCPEKIPKELSDLFLNHTESFDWQQFCILPNIQDTHLSEQLLKIIQTAGYSIQEINNLTSIDMDADGENEVVVLAKQDETSGLAFYFVMKEMNNEWKMIGEECGNPSELYLIKQNENYYIVNGSDIGFLDTDASETDTVETNAVKTNAAKMNAAKTNAVKTNAAKTNAVKMNAAKTSTAKTNITKTSAVKTRVAKTNIAKTSAAKMNIAKINAVETGNLKNHTSGEEISNYTEYSKFWHRYSLQAKNIVYVLQENVYQMEDAISEYRGMDEYDLEKLNNLTLNTTGTLCFDCEDYTYATDTLYQSDKNDVVFGFFSIQKKGELEQLTDNAVMLVLRQTKKDTYEIIQVNYMQANETLIWESNKN